MPMTRVYYRLKPMLPRPLRLFLRRRHASQLRERVGALWPVFPGSERPPEGWAGWPEGKKFCLVLTHDVEGPAGLGKCSELMRREQALGFRSSFNFIPEGSYRVSPELRRELTANGFEVGIHDLRHDGHLFASLPAFEGQAVRINQHLQEWNAHGFRSGFMLQNLDWLHQLKIQYDASTFDTDPFEPQPEGRHTIFPFWIDRPDSKGSSPVPEGYVELPYTLCQDSTLFLILQEKTIDIWKRKLDWVASHGGMVLLNTHPDYMAMEGSPHGQFEFPVKHYEELLQYVNSTYPGQFWHALPHEVASLVQARETTRRHQHPGGASPVPSRHGMKRKPKIWIDLDNTPHVPFFEPIMEELESRGYPLLVTARDAFQVCELADKKGLPYFKVGRHHGKNKFRKATGLMHRASQLASLVLREGPLLGVSHGSRSQLMLSNLLRIPTLLIEDYEYCQFPFMMKPSWILAPDIIPGEVLPVRPDRVRHYSGIKEDVYAWKLVPDPSLRLELGLAPDDLVVTVRPPATEAHYHNPESEILFAAFMDRACRTPGVRVILLPRNQRQRLALEKEKPEWFRENRTVVPQGAVDGMNLIWQSDLVVSGGGTMNREAAALGVPVFSLFRGNLGAVDRQLNLEGRLGLITSLADVDRIPVVKRQVKPVTEVTSRSTLIQIVDTIEEIAAFHLASR